MAAPAELQAERKTKKKEEAIRAISGKGTSLLLRDKLNVPFGNKRWHTNVTKGKG